jgi:hypothetical protein
VIMSVPPDKLMELMKGSQAAAGASTPNEMPEEMDTELPEAPPMASPMSTPEPKMGNKEAALINISMAIDLLEQSLPAFGSVSEEGKKTLNAIRALSGLIGQKKGKTDELQQSEILQLLQTLPQAGGATPEGRAMAQAPIPGMPPAGGMPPPPPM